MEALAQKRAAIGNARGFSLIFGAEIALDRDGKEQGYRLSHNWTSNTRKAIILMDTSPV